jgi:hypothetical protein
MPPPRLRSPARQRAPVALKRNAWGYFLGSKRDARYCSAPIKNSNNPAAIRSVEFRNSPRLENMYDPDSMPNPPRKNRTGRSRFIGAIIPARAVVNLIGSHLPTPGATSGGIRVGANVRERRRRRRNFCAAAATRCFRRQCRHHRHTACTAESRGPTAHQPRLPGTPERAHPWGRFDNCLPRPAGGL